MKVLIENVKLMILLFSFWLILTMDITTYNLIVGLLISVLTAILSGYILNGNYGVKVRVPSIFNIFRFLVRLIFEIYWSSFSYIVRIIKRDCNPIFVKVKLNTKSQIVSTMISNAITLTPGTLTVNLEKDELIILSIDDPKKNGMSLTREVKEKYEQIFLGKDDN